MGASSMASSRAKFCGAIILVAELVVAVSLDQLPGRAARAAPNMLPTGVWIDHEGRGAVEISKCGQGLCGEIVWVKDEQTGSKACGLQIIGNVKKIGHNTWDQGWILDPEMGEKFDVELKPMSKSKLQVMGYLGVKTLSETMVWSRAPNTLKRCTS